jgi:hypothetical protein
MPRVIVNETQIVPANGSRFWTSTSSAAETIREKWNTYVNSGKVTFTKNSSILENGKIQIVTTSTWNNQSDFNEWQSWYSQYHTVRDTFNSENGIIVNRTETIE